MSTQITVRLPDELAIALGEAAAALKCSRAEVVRQAIEQYLEDFWQMVVTGGHAGEPVHGGTTDVAEPPVTGRGRGSGVHAGCTIPCMVAAAATRLPGHP